MSNEASSAGFSGRGTACSRLRRICGGGLLAAACGAWGCGPPAVRLVPVEGVVTIAGAPAADVAIQFLPDPVEGRPSPTSFATSDSAGRFRLRTQDGHDGALAGGHTVLLVDTLEERPAQGEEPTRPPRLESKYATVKGGLRCEVPVTGGPVSVAVP